MNTVTTVNSVAPAAADPATQASGRAGVLTPTERRARTARQFRSALRSEGIKLRTVRTTPALVGLSGVIGIAMAVVLGVVVKTDPYEHLPFTIGNTFLVSTWLTTLLSVVAGVLLVTSEVQHGTLANAFVARPARRVVISAKAGAAALLGLTLGAVGIAGSLVGGVAGRLDTGDLSGAASGTGWALLLTTLAAVLGVGVGMIVRHGAAAITAVLVWATAAENVIRGVAPARISRMLPFDAANRLLGTRSATDTAETLAASFSRFGNALVFGGYAVAALALGSWMMSRRDA